MQPWRQQQPLLTVGPRGPGWPIGPGRPTFPWNAKPWVNFGAMHPKSREKLLCCGRMYFDPNRKSKPNYEAFTSFFIRFYKSQTNDFLRVGEKHLMVWLVITLHVFHIRASLTGGPRSPGKPGFPALPLAPCKQYRELKDSTTVDQPRQFHKQRNRNYFQATKQPSVCSKPRVHHSSADRIETKSKGICPLFRDADPTSTGNVSNKKDLCRLQHHRAATACLPDPLACQHFRLGLFGQCAPATSTNSHKDLTEWISSAWFCWLEEQSQSTG